MNSIHPWHCILILFQRWGGGEFYPPLTLYLILFQRWGGGEFYPPLTLYLILFQRWGGGGEFYPPLTLYFVSVPEMGRRWILSTPGTVFDCIFQRWVGGEFYPSLTLYLILFQRWGGGGEFYPPLTLYFVSVPEMGRRWILSTPDTVFDCIFQRWVGGEFYPPLTLYFDCIFRRWVIKEVNSIHPWHCIWLYLPEMSRRWILSTPDTVFDCIFQRWVGGEFYPPLTLYFDSVPGMRRRWILSTRDTVFWFCFRDEEEVNSIHPWHCILILFQGWGGGEFYPPVTLYFDSVSEMRRRWILSTPDTVFWFCSRDEEEVNSIHPWHCILILFQRWVGGEFYPPLTLYFDSVSEMRRRWILSTPDTVFLFCSRDE